MKNILIILGNGFDLDFGLKTSYINFWIAKKETIEKKYVDHFDHKNVVMPTFSEDIDKNIYTWGDLEEILRIGTSPAAIENMEPALAVFRLSGIKGSTKANQVYFNYLKQELINYLKEQQCQNINEHSLAAQCLQQWGSSKDKLNIFNFNYTDINEYTQKLNINRTFEVNYIHGNLKNKNIILGVGDAQLYEGYGFVLKKVQGAKISPIEEAILKAEKVIFFGVSFGFNDFQYFKEFFLAIKEGKLKTSIDIYTKDEKSANDIFQRLSAIGVTKRDLFINADLHIEQTVK